MESQASPNSSDLSDHLWRFFVFGPITGAVIGALQVTATFHVWVMNGRPEFWIGGRGGYDISPLLFIYALGGMSFGVPFGLSVIWFETATNRRVLMAYFLLLLVLAAYLIGVVVSLVEFSQGRLFFMVAEGAAIIAGWALMFLLSRRTSISN